MRSAIYRSLILCLLLLEGLAVNSGPTIKDTEECTQRECVCDQGNLGTAPCATGAICGVFQNQAVCGSHIYAEEVCRDLHLCVCKGMEGFNLIVPTICGRWDYCSDSVDLATGVRRATCRQYIEEGELCGESTGCTCRIKESFRTLFPTVEYGYVCKRENEKPEKPDVPYIEMGSVCEAERCFCKGVKVINLKDFVKIREVELVRWEKCHEEIQTEEIIRPLLELGDVVKTEEGYCRHHFTQGLGSNTLEQRFWCKQGQMCATDFEKGFCYDIPNSLEPHSEVVKDEAGKFVALPAIREATKDRKSMFALCASTQTLVVTSNRVYCKGSEKALWITDQQVCPNIGKGGCLCAAPGDLGKSGAPLATCKVGMECQVKNNQPKCQKRFESWFCGESDACECDKKCAGPNCYCVPGKALNFFGENKVDLSEEEALKLNAFDRLTILATYRMIYLKSSGALKWGDHPKREVLRAANIRV